MTWLILFYTVVILFFISAVIGWLDPKSHKPLRRIKNIELDHAKSFLDVIFGALIALHLMEKLPELVNNITTHFPRRMNSLNIMLDVMNILPSAVSLLLLTSALIFTAFYWLEVRRFIDEQSTVNKIIIEKMTLSLGRFFFSLIMIGLVALILSSANIDLFRLFLATNILFWSFDFLGNIEFKLRYSRADLVYLQRYYVSEYQWLTARTLSYHFIMYSIGNAMFYIVILLGDICYERAEGYRAGGAVAIFLVTLIRHLLWRVRL